MARRKCPCCGQPVESPYELEPGQLKGFRGIVGHRLGWKGPLPQYLMAQLLYISPRTYTNYECGHTKIPPLVGKEALRLTRAVPEILAKRIPKKAFAKREVEQARRARFKAVDPPGRPPKSL